MSMREVELKQGAIETIGPFVPGDHCMRTTCVRGKQGSHVSVFVSSASWSRHKAAQLDSRCGEYPFVQSKSNVVLIYHGLVIRCVAGCIRISDLRMWQIYHLRGLPIYSRNLA
jgi:hypothetical protein